MVDFNPFGQLAEVQRYKDSLALKLAQFQQQKQQNALANALTMAQLNAAQQGIADRNSLGTTLQNLAAPIQSGGPLANPGEQGYQPVSFTQQPVTRERLFNALAAAGNPKALDLVPQDEKAIPLASGAQLVTPTGKVLATNPKDESSNANLINDFATFYRGFASKHPELSGGSLDYAANSEWHKMKLEEAKQTGLARGEGYAGFRMYPMLDTTMGNSPVQVSATELARAEKEQPGRYIAASQGEKALTRTALISDIRGTISNVRNAMQGMPDFNAEQRAQLALVMKERNTTSAVSNFLSSQWGRSLTPEQQNYVIDLAQLKENAMAMRSVLGAGQGSEDLRRAIIATIPGPMTPNKEYGFKQLDKFEQVLNRLERGIPSVNLAPEKAGRKYQDNQLSITQNNLSDTNQTTQQTDYYSRYGLEPAK